MIFNTPIFFFFFIIFLFFYGFVFLRQTPKVYFILVSSLVFYGAWNYHFIPLLVGSAVADYFIAQAIGNCTDQRRKKLWVALSISINLGILALFKYADFALQSVADFLLLFGYEASIPTLQWVLPVGISFYTFQSLSYTIDVYRGDMEPRKGLVEFTAALSFFPQLVAGPILRARHILPQMHNIQLPQWDQVKQGFLLITVGLMKKTTADLLAVPAATAFDGSQSVSLLETWTGVLAFAGQIYGDFSGYSDMAIGIAMLLGFNLPLNFRLPYFASSPVDFWRRWHISLSSWLRDYLYVSLGGNRTGHRYRNVFITMLLGGLWHGAAWTFIAWGMFHGMIITATHYLSSLPALQTFIGNQNIWARIARWAMTFYLILIGWVLFRATSLDSAFTILMDMHLLNDLPEAAQAALPVFGLVVLALGLMHWLDYFVIHHVEKLKERAWLFWSLLVLGQGLCLLVGEPSNEFIYFQF
ncbi:MBOAT family protein [Pleionea sp. CnH1-48]|uniref:MBOAT family O-acyltransferase n=1 Tax=Pleionea sp. CnH1-48 TaxID=2954494 RepID=UPI0020969C76|nr:MBOAT family O-acyltransferase [Pleionea sp. CnH1-48]MCO7224926.1 MBOAT family protein [Pleionea sp. CnH1-48]